MTWKHFLPLQILLGLMTNSSKFSSQSYGGRDNFVQSTCIPIHGLSDITDKILQNKNSMLLLLGNKYSAIVFALFRKLQNYFSAFHFLSWGVLLAIIKCAVI